ncbi:MAG: hypothetical protein EZS28_012299 [Streblomastix strix]|uniref:Uncharacterized protein n=1 Tax=Streblomastix strix TaxID=222440 RepID=A0A5J4WBY8_9EUKA|nr:MAG: hypothetical protein EZS28_012299 [Streblomastix strix]
MSESEEEDQQVEEKTRGTGKKKKGKKALAKDPNAPKHPMPPYLIFQKEVREKVLQKLQDENNGVRPQPTVVSSSVGKLWRSLTTEQKQPYIDIFEKQQKEYQLRVQEYENSGKKAEWLKLHSGGMNETQNSTPSPEALAIKIRQYFNSNQGEDQLSLKKIRRHLESQFKCNLREQKALIQALVNNTADEEVNTRRSSDQSQSQ